MENKKSDPKWDKALNILNDWENNYCEVTDRRRNTKFVCTLKEGFIYLSNNQTLLGGQNNITLKLFDPANNAVKVLFAKKGTKT